jgi:hypothetical protein
MHGGEPKDHEIFAQDDSREGFFRSLLRPESDYCYSQTL